MVGLVTVMVAGVWAHAAVAITVMAIARKLSRRIPLSILSAYETQPLDVDREPGGHAGGGRQRVDAWSVETESRRVADLRRRSREHTLLAARSDHREQFQQAAARVPVQDREPRAAT